jgi:tetratricopeptide (TPR) repeat protein
MNNNLLTIVKQIIAQNDEDILTDARRVNAFFADLAKDEPKSEKRAFLACVEAGAYNALKTAPDAAERTSRKTAIAERVHTDEGFDLALCNDALDLFAAALFAEQSQTPRCPSCGKDIDPAWKACPFCGAALAAEPEQTAQTANPEPQNAVLEQPAQETAPAPQDAVPQETPPAAQPAPDAPKQPAAPAKKTSRNALIAVGIIVIGAILGFLAYQKHTAQVWFDRGVELAKQEQYDQAISAFTESLRIDSNNAKAYVNRGYAYYLKEDYDRAIADYTEALRIDPNYARAYVNRGIAYYWKEDYDRAIADYTQAITLDPSDAVAYRSRGLAYYVNNEDDKAITDFTLAIAYGSNGASTYCDRGNAYYFNDEYGKAIDDFTYAIALSPNYAYAYNRRGLAYYSSGLTNLAIQDLAKAATLDQNSQKFKDDLRRIRGY